MIAIKNSRELQAMREACVISARALKLAGEAVEPGVTTGEIDALVRRYIESKALVSRLRRISRQRLHLGQ